MCIRDSYRKTLEKEGITWLCRCLNYHTEWRPQDGETLREQLEKAAEVRDL